MGQLIQKISITVSGANFQGWGANLLFGQILAEKCMKMKEFGPRGGGVSLAPPPKSTNDCPTRWEQDMSDKSGYWFE